MVAEARVEAEEAQAETGADYRAYFATIYSPVTSEGEYRAALFQFSFSVAYLTVQRRPFDRPVRL